MSRIREIPLLIGCPPRLPSTCWGIGPSSEILPGKLVLVLRKSCRGVFEWRRGRFYRNRGSAVETAVSPVVSYSKSVGLSVSGVRGSFSAKGRPRWSQACFVIWRPWRVRMTKPICNR